MDAMQGVSHRHISDHLSELVETTLTDLSVSKVDSSPYTLLWLCATHYLISWRQLPWYCEDATTHSVLVLGSWAKTTPAVYRLTTIDVFMP